MKDWVNSSMSFINIMLNISKLIPIKSKQYCKYFLYKILLYFVSFLFLVSAYVFGCIALYNYLMPHWGETLAAFSLCLLSFIISFGLIITGMVLNSKKKKPSPQVFPLLEKSLGHFPDSQDLMKTLAKASPAVLISVLGVTAIATYIVFFKNKGK